MRDETQPREHLHFIVRAEVTRLTETQDPADKTITGYTAALSVECEDCGEPFTFLGLDVGVSFTHPRVSADGATLRAPIQPRAWGDPMTAISPAPAEA